MSKVSDTALKMNIEKFNKVHMKPKSNKITKTKAVEIVNITLTKLEKSNAFNKLPWHWIQVRNLTDPGTTDAVFLSITPLNGIKVMYFEVGEDPTFDFVDEDRIVGVGNAFDIFPKVETKSKCGAPGCDCAGKIEIWSKP
jgi:hypothetical protein